MKMNKGKDFAQFVDTLRKLDAEHRMPSGGSQYTMEVAAGPSASAKNQARMRVEKTKAVKPMRLAALIRNRS